jgi:uncharacterized protein YciI
MQEFIYRLRLVARLQSESAWGEAEHATLQRHVSYLKDAAMAGTVILAGRTREDFPVTFGLVVYRALDEKAAWDFMAADPAVLAGMMTAELHSFSVVVAGK